jgi:hypothetical protein
MAAQADEQTRAQPLLQINDLGATQVANPREHNSLVAEGPLSVPIEATCRLGDYRHGWNTPALASSAGCYSASKLIHRSR